MTFRVLACLSSLSAMLAAALAGSGHRTPALFPFGLACGFLGAAIARWRDRR